MKKVNFCKLKTLLSRNFVYNLQALGAPLREMGLFTTSLGPGSTVLVNGQQKIGEGKKINKLGDVSPCFLFPLDPFPSLWSQATSEPSGFISQLPVALLPCEYSHLKWVAFPHQQLAMRGNWFYRLQLWVPEFLWVHQPQMAGNWA